MSKKVVVAMSGGVDSSVAAALLVQRGYDVTGVMLKLWSSDDINTSSGCCSVGAAEDARRVADTLGIPFYCLNLAEEFESTVVADFQSEYARGRTPNPCVRCNQWIKFDALLERAEALGADSLATGHYVRLDELGSRMRLRRGVDAAKDQSYVLWMLSSEQLRRCIFPIGELEKTETRRIATELGLRTAAKPDSQEICFVRDGDAAGYVAKSVPSAGLSGPFVDASGNVVGTHAGIGRYTVGQRKGLGIALGHPVFVTDIDPATNTVTVGTRDDLLVDEITLEEVSAVDRPPSVGDRVLVQHRAHGEASPAAVVEVRPGGSIVLRYAAPVEAVAPGQSAALYGGSDGDEVLGGGIIASAARVAPRVPA